jgi:hypothetical protein
MPVKGRRYNQADTPDDADGELTGYRHTICIDWDGTLVPSVWPDRPTEWMPGAEDALRDMCEYAHVLVFSARTRREDPRTHEKIDPALVQEEVDYIRSMLDKSGFTMVGIWTRHGKPTADVYIDDKAERYNGRPNSWKRMAQKMRLRFLEPSAAFPPFEKGLS